MFFFFICTHTAVVLLAVGCYLAPQCVLRQPTNAFCIEGRCVCVSVCLLSAHGCVRLTTGLFEPRATRKWSVPTFQVSLTTLARRVRARARARLGLAYRTVWGQPVSQCSRFCVSAHYVFTISAAWVAFTLLLAATIAAHWQCLTAG